MASEVFVIYGCPYTAFEATKAVDAFVVPEPDRTLYHLGRNTNRILNLVGFSGVKGVRLIGCSPEFIEEFTALLAGYQPAGFRVSTEGKTCTAFSEYSVGDANAADVIVVERQPNLIPIAQQLAREGRAKIVLIDPISDEETAAFSAGHKDFEDGSGLARQNGLDACCEIVQRKLGSGFFASPFSSATFITRFPYNLFPFTFPTGHLPTHAAGELATASMLKASYPTLSTGVAVILDSGNTQATGDSESGALRDWLSRNYGVLPANGCATLGDFKHFMEDLPADLIFLTAHCGDNIPLTELEATFRHNGKVVQVRYAVDRGVSAVPKSGVVGCQTNYLPLEVNGVSWNAEGCDRKLFLNFSKIEMDASLGMKSRNPEFQDVAINAISDATSRRFPSKCMQCGDGQFFVPLTHTIGSYYFPLVFNNACASYAGICEEFLRDVSFYVGTSRSVDSFLAVDVATRFVQNLSTMSVGNALFEAQRGFIKDHTPYLLAGVPWLSLPRYTSPAIAITKANTLLKGLRGNSSDDTRSGHGRLLFQEQQRNILLKQLFGERERVSQ